MTQIPRLLAHEMGLVYGLQHSRIDGSTDDTRTLGHHDRRSRLQCVRSGISLIGPGVNASNMRSRRSLDELRVWKAAEQLR